MSVSDTKPFSGKGEESEIKCMFSKFQKQKLDPFVMFTYLNGRYGGLVPDESVLYTSSGVFFKYIT